MRTIRYDYAVVGGGIAGLAIAEIFARSGHSVVLIEQEKTLCQGASASQHGWFHFGSLYSIFPQNQFLRTLVCGVEDILTYYAEFPGMNIYINEIGRLSFPQASGSWFRDEPIEYIVSARNNPDFDMRSFDGMRNYAKKAFFLMTWEMAIKQFISRHQRFHKHNWAGKVMASEWIARAGFGDYSREVITKPILPGVNLDIDTHFRIVGYDRPMRATAIIRELTRSLLGAGGTITTTEEVNRIETVGSIKRLHTKNGHMIEAGKVIIAAGKWIGHFLRHDQDVKVVASPLIVTYPAVSNNNFVRMTPFVEKSVNHLHHDFDGKNYSLIGGGYFADPKFPEALEYATQQLLTMAHAVFPKLKDAQILESYLGYKTEIVSAVGERNYQYIIREVDDGIFAAIQGKFSLAFSLATNTYKRLTGDMPSKQIEMAPPDAAEGYIGLTQHAQIIQNGLRKLQE